MSDTVSGKDKLAQLISVRPVTPTIKKTTLACVISALIAAAPVGAGAESLTLAQVLQRALERDATLRVAGMQLERARQDTERAEGQLGWTLNGQGGVARDVNTVGAPVDRSDISAGVERRLESGSTMGLSAGAVREDGETTLSPLLPNPSQTTRVDLSYRMPLAKGTDNAEYRGALEGADAAAESARADHDAGRNQLGQRTADLFYGAALTRARLATAEEAIRRAERFRSFIAANQRLGVSEEKDRLQAEAQWRARVAEHGALTVTWENQRTALNRLMERDWDSEWQPLVAEAAEVAPADLRLLEAEATAQSPDLRRERARLRTAEAALARSRDAVRDKADLVLSVGNRTLEGDVMGTTASTSERVGSLRFEYRAALDRRGSDAEVTQAYLDRAMAQQRIDSVQTELRYTVARLAAEIASAAAAQRQAQARQQAEQAKLDDATRRHRQGRIDTAQVIQFENDYEAATLALTQQTIDLARRRTELDIVRGALWRDVVVPPPAPGPRP
jgi:outer membrane protein TolC